MTDVERTRTFTFWLFPELSMWHPPSLYSLLHSFRMMTDLSTETCDDRYLVNFWFEWMRSTFAWFLHCRRFNLLCKCTEIIPMVYGADCDGSSILTVMVWYIAIYLFLPLHQADFASHRHVWFSWCIIYFAVYWLTYEHWFRWLDFAVHPSLLAVFIIACRFLLWSQGFSNILPLSSHCPGICQVC